MNIKTALCAALAWSALSFAPRVTAQTNVGQWDFTNGNLSATIGGTPLAYADETTQGGTVFGTTTQLGIPGINGSPAFVMGFPASGATGGYELPVAIGPNGGSPDLANNYTIVMDVLFPASTAGRVRPLLQTDGGIITPDADFVVDSTGGIGAPPGPYTGSIQTNTWYRLAFSVTSTEIEEFINGVEVGTQPSGGLDNRFALEPAGDAQLFQNSTTNGAAPGYVSSIQLWNDALSPGQIAALGLPSASKIPTTISAIPAFIVSRVPTPNNLVVPPVTPISAILNPGGTVLATNTIHLVLDGVTLGTNITYDGTNYTVSAAPTNILAPFSPHTASLIYSDSVAGLITNSWNFSVFGYQNVNLPAPIYLETFDEVAEGGIPAGWSVTNWTDSLTPGLNLFNTQSDSYLNWVTISTSDYATVYPDTDNYLSPGFPQVAGNRRQMLPPIVENGVLLTNLASGNLIVAESDQRGGSQVQVLFTKDFNLTGYNNVYVSFHDINEQNQDNVCSVEYSVDQGVTWLPLLYMLDDGSTDTPHTPDVITNQFTGQIDVVATFETARTDQAHGLAYGAFIGAAITTNLIPAIRPERQDDPVCIKRIEILRLPLADNSPTVRLRFMEAGTASWYFDMDNFGFYSIPQPIILNQPQPVIADYNGPATFTVNAGGSNLVYQWLFDSTNISGATSSSYTIANTASNNIGFYNVIVSNTFGAVISQPVTLTLIETPAITSAPLAQTVAPGEAASFAVTASGGLPLSYQWLFNSNAIPGATNITYDITSAATNNTGYYQVQVSNAFSTVLSPNAFLEVFSGPITNDMVVHLTFDGNYNDTSGEGNNASPIGTPTFVPGFLGQAVHVTSAGSPANAPSTNNIVTLGYPSDLKFGSDLTGDAVDFSVSFWTKIYSQNDDKPFISNKDWDSGSNPGWVINTEGGGMKWNYRDDAINTPGVGSARRDSPTVYPSMEDGGWHHVVVTMARRSVGTIYIDGLLVNQSPLGTDSLTNILGSADTDGLGFNVNIGEDGTGTYTDDTSGAAADMLIDDLAIWRRVLTDKEALGIFNAGLNSNTVDQASTTSPGAKPQITLQPVGAGAGTGATVTFKVSSIGTPSIGYQWYDGLAAVPNQTNATYAVTNVQSTSQGSYTVVITNGYGAVTSQVAVLTFTGVLRPTIAVQPVSTNVIPGIPVAFTALGAGNGALTYQWYSNNVAVSGATNTNYVIASAQAVDAGSYFVAIANSGGVTNSVQVLLNVFTGSLGDNIVAYLPFDGNYLDYSGHGHNGTPFGSPSFAPGKVGQALHISSGATNLFVTNYVSLGYPGDLQFGTNSFTVSFWVNYTVQFDDSPFIANKNWASSGNVGWGIFSQSGGNFRVNATGASGTKMDTTSTPLIRDGNWHHVLSVFWRGGRYTSTYVDGQLINTSPLTFSGSVDTVASGYAVNIGQDGTGKYTDGGEAYLDALIDEVTLWNRPVTPQEVPLLYAAGNNGQTPFTLITNAVSAARSITVSWYGGIAPFTVQTNSSLSNPVWSSFGTTSAQSITVPTGGAACFIRINGSN